jgi:hypothetical protein
MFDNLDAKGVRFAIGARDVVREDGLRSTEGFLYNASARGFIADRRPFSERKNPFQLKREEAARQARGW